MINTKRVLLITLAVAGLLALPRIGSAAINKGIEGSAHDFSTNAWNVSRKGVCSACHSAHNTDTNQIAPLWNHATSAATFTPYSSPTLNASVGLPSGVSLACLSCHDGTVAVNQGISGSFTGGRRSISIRVRKSGRTCTSCIRSHSPMTRLWPMPMANWKIHRPIR